MVWEVSPYAAISLFWGRSMERPYRKIRRSPLVLLSLLNNTNYYLIYEYTQNGRFMHWDIITSKRCSKALSNTCFMISGINFSVS